jgi:hypothetical protein
VTVRASLLVLPYFAFIGLGRPDGLLGVGWASTHVDLRVPTDAVGFPLFAGTAGYLTGRRKRASASSGSSVGRRFRPGPARGRLVTGLVAGLSLAGYGGRAGVLVHGAVRAVRRLRRRADRRRPQRVRRQRLRPAAHELLHACFGLGVTIGPLVMTAFVGSVTGAGLGGALLPAGIGVLLTRHGVTVLGPALTVLSAVLLGLYLVLHRPQPDRSTQVAA